MSDNPNPTSEAFVPRAAAEIADAARARPYTTVTVASVAVGVAAWKTMSLLRTGGPADRLAAAAKQVVKNTVRDWTADDPAPDAETHKSRKVLITPNAAE